MASLLNPTELASRIRRDAQRSVLRAKNGVKYLAGVDRPKVGLTPKDTVWTRDKLQLWRYKNDNIQYRPPLFLVMSLVSRSYVLDLRPKNSFVEFMRDQGIDVFLLDWGVPDHLEANNTLETYCDDYLPEAVEAAMDVAGVEEISLLGYCFGGVLSLIYAAAHPEAPIRNFLSLATPVDFHKMGFQSAMTAEGRVEPEEMIDETGNVPPEVILNSFRVLKPTSDVAGYVNLWQNMWNDEFLDGYQAMNQWAKDQIPFPGACMRQTVELLNRENAFINDTLRLGGRRITLKDIKMPFLSVLGERDHIAPFEATSPLIDLVGSEDKEELRLPAGHVGLVGGRTAQKVTLPTIADWLKRHSDRVEG